MPLDQTWNYLSPAKIVFGQNSFQTLKKIVLNQNITKNILLVTGQVNMKKYGYVDQIYKMLYNWSVYHFDAISPDPTPEVIQEGMKFIEPRKIELIIALGGGSVLDAGKVFSTLQEKSHNLHQCLLLFLESDPFFRTAVRVDLSLV